MDPHWCHRLRRLLLPNFLVYGVAASVTARKTAKIDKVEAYPGVKITENPNLMTDGKWNLLDVCNKTVEMQNGLWSIVNADLFQLS